MQLNEFVDEVTALRPGETLVYHVGHLGQDREFNEDLSRVASKALLFGTKLGVPVMREGRVTGVDLAQLTQKKIKCGFEYRLTRNRQQGKYFK
jgi:hypothetical protein|tara:strand:- start:5136 stop:5414 length:279 start_codon:yes stop_codon:yes gene_type:complete